MTVAQITQIRETPGYRKACNRDSHYWKSGVPTYTEIYDAWHYWLISDREFRDLLRYCDPYSTLAS